MGRRLQYVMAAVMHEAAADEDNVPYGIDTPQFADGINEDHRIFRPCPVQFFQLGTITGLIAEFAVEPFDLIGPVSFTGCDHKTGFGIFFTQFRKGCQHRLFFRGMGRTCYDNRERIGSQSQFGFIRFQIFRCNLRIGLVKFRVSGNEYFLGIGSQMSNVIGVDTGLHAETAYGPKHVSPDAEQVTVVLYGFFGNTAVYHHHRDVPFPDGPQEIRPQFCFYRHEDTGMYPAYHGLGHPDKVQGEIDDGVCFRYDLLCHVVAAYGKGRYQHLPFRHDLLDFFYQRAGGYDFAY